MKHAVILATAFLLHIGVCSTVRGGIMTRQGNEPGFWKERAVIVARVIADDKMGGRGRASLEVLSVLWTDRPIKTKFDIEYGLGAGAAYGGQFRPEKGDIYILCLGSEEGGAWELEGNILKFFESGISAEYIETADDPKVKRLVERMQKLQNEARAAEIKQAVEEGIQAGQ